MSLYYILYVLFACHYISKNIYKELKSTTTTEHTFMALFENCRIDIKTEKSTLGRNNKKGKFIGIKFHISYT